MGLENAINASVLYLRLIQFIKI